MLVYIFSKCLIEGTNNEKNHLFKFFTLVVILLLFSGCTGSGADDGPVIFSVSAVAIGSTHTLAVAMDGTLWAWGDNSNGQLGNGTAGNTTAFAKIGENFSCIAAGSYHTIACASDNSIYTWGKNSDGQLGDGGVLTNSTVPILIDSGTAWTAVTSCNDHSAALKTDGTLWMWGKNDEQQIGNGGISDVLLPSRIIF